MSQPRIAHETSYSHSLVDSDTAPPPYIDLDEVDDEYRKVIRAGDMWYPYSRFEVLVRHTLEPVLDETARDVQSTDQDFDIRSLCDDDLVCVGNRYYDGYDIKRLIEEDSTRDTLLGVGPVIEHQCPPPKVITKTVTVEKPSRWRGDFGFSVGIVGCLAVLSGLVFWMLLGEHLEPLPLRGPYFIAFVPTLNMCGFSWLLMEWLAAKRKRSDQPIPAEWRLFAYGCITAAMFGIGVLTLACASPPASLY